MSKRNGFAYRNRDSTTRVASRVLTTSVVVRVLPGSKRDISLGVVNLQVYESPWELERAIDKFYRFYSYERYHEALGNVTPADIYFGRAQEVLSRRKELKERTMTERRARYAQWKLRQKDLKVRGFGGIIIGGSESGKCVVF